METSEATRQCATHGEYVAKLIHMGERTLGGSCPSCQQDREAAEATRTALAKAEASRRRIEYLFNRAGIPPRFQKRNFENYEFKHEGQEHALRVSRNYVQVWDRMAEQGTCLIFSGSPGTGKTHLACAIANALIAQGVASLFTTVSDAMRSIKRSYDASSTVSEAEAIQAFVEPRLLILDEVGGSKGTDHELQLMFDIINKRYEHSRPTIILTNLDAPALREHLGERVTDRLREGGGKLVAFTWSSHRS